MTTTTLDRPTPITAPPTMQPKRLSEALRRGARLHPQGRSAIYRDGKTCALGALLVGLVGPEHVENGEIPPGLMTTIVKLHTGVDLTQIVEVPLTAIAPGHRTTLSWAAVLLNDAAQWTREQIADWLQSLDL